MKELEVEKIYDWEGEGKLQICSVFIKFFRKIWVEWSERI